MIEYTKQIFLEVLCPRKERIMAELTEKQQQIYNYILAFSAQHGYPPSVREIGAAMGMKSPSTVQFHLNCLRKAGVIQKVKGKTRSLTAAGQRPRSVGEESNPRVDRVPVLGNVAAGSPILAQEQIEDYLTFDTEGLSGEHFALRVRGESMLGAGILPGDLVVVHRQQEADSGEIVVALFEDEATVKTLSYENDRMWLLPQNPDYSPIDGTAAQILGKVVAVVRRY
jgi:repressor LexA